MSDGLHSLETNISVRYENGQVSSFIVHVHRHEHKAYKTFHVTESLPYNAALIEARRYRDSLKTMDREEFINQRVRAETRKRNEAIANAEAQALAERAERIRRNQLAAEEQARREANAPRVEAARRAAQSVLVKYGIIQEWEPYGFWEGRV